MAINLLRTFKQIYCFYSVVFQLIYVFQCNITTQASFVTVSRTVWFGGSSFWGNAKIEILSSERICLFDITWKWKIKKIFLSILFWWIQLVKLRSPHSLAMSLLQGISFFSSSHTLEFIRRRCHINLARFWAFVIIVSMVLFIFLHYIFIIKGIKIWHES